MNPDTGRQCVEWWPIEGDHGSWAGQTAERNLLRLISTFGACPDQPFELPSGPTAEMAALLVWHELITLPTPTLDIPPGEAITGLPTYLIIGGPTTDSPTYPPSQALGYRITFDIASTYDIDWGDGTVQRGVTSQGGAYPYGDLRHGYVHTDPDNAVTVSQHWTATWAATAPDGTTSNGAITAPLTTTATLPLPIGEIQAVRTR